MNNLNPYLSLIYPFMIEQEIIIKNFEQKAEEAKKKYWDACKYPRKTKKRMRKEALADYSLYITLKNNFEFPWLKCSRLG